MSDRGPLGVRLRNVRRRARADDGPTLASAAVVVGVLLLNVLQQPGRITFDTKLDLQFAPLEFLGRSLSLWNPDSALGGLQNQASGYLFPMGPAFVLGDQLGVPSWVWERLWSAVVMLVAYEGARRLARSWPGVGRWGAVMAGLAYMAAPRVLTTVGALSGETLPAAVLPWTVLPLALYLTGAWRRWPGLVLSAVSVLFMGGQNATLVFACLILPGLLLLTAAGRPARRVLADVAAWSGLVLMAILWWLVPLVLLGSYAPPFLDFIESARTTASRTGWLTSLRGTNHWVAFLSGGGDSGWLGGWQLATSSVLLATTVLVALLGLAGLALGRLSFRTPLLLSLILGLAVLTLGRGGWSGSLLAAGWLDALDTWLAPLRNVHKFDPLVRLPLSLGVGAFVTTVVPLLAAKLPRGHQRRGAGALVVATALLVLAAAQPAVAGHLRSEDGMEALPDEWREAATYLESVPDPVGVLVLPGSGFAVQEWGRTVDEPIQVLGGPPWAARAQVTVAPAGTLRVLDALERRLAEGRPVPGVAEVLRRLGVTHVLVRDDLDPEHSDAPSAELVRAGLSGSLDVAPVAAFGDGLTDGPRLEIYEVEGDEDRRVSLQDWDERLVVDGPPESLVDLVGAGVLGPNQPMTILGDSEAGTSDDGGIVADVLTDGNRRVERSFGRVHGALSGVMSAEDEFRFARPVHDYLGEEVPAQQTVAEYDGIAGVVASSSAGYADTFGRVQPEDHPYSAVDPSPFTSWGSDPFAEPEDQWLELRLAEAVELGDVSLLFDVTNGARVTSVELVTDAGETVVDVDADGRLASTALPEGATDRLRVVVQEAAEGPRQVRLSDLDVEGLDIRRSLRLPGSLAGDAILHVSAETPRRPCSGIAPTTTCEAGQQVETPETAGFSRTFDVGEDGSWEVRGWAVATHGPTLATLLEPLQEELVTVRASSTFGGDPAVAAVNAHDGRPGTTWYAASSDLTPVLDLTWKEPRTIRSVVATLADGAPGRLPDAFFVDPVQEGEEPQMVAVTGPTAGDMKSVRTTRLRLTAVFEDVAPDEDAEGVGISELDIAGLRDLRHRPDPGAETGVVCGFGPRVSIGDRELRFGVRGTVRDVQEGSRLELTPCRSDRVELGQGEHRLDVSNESGFSVSDLVLRPTGEEDLVPAAGGVGDASVQEWGSVRRSVLVDVGRGAVLTVPESFNVGWEATIGGKELPAVRVDGWKQGWVLPEGSTGLVVLTYAPQGPFVAGLAVGAGLAAGLVVASAFLWRRRRQPSTSAAAPATAPRWSLDMTTAPGRVVGGVALLSLALVSVWLAVGVVLGAAAWHFSPATQQRLLRAGLALLPLAVGLALVLGDSPFSPPAAADALAALAVGLAVGWAFRADQLDTAPGGDETAVHA